MAAFFRDRSTTLKLAVLSFSTGIGLGIAQQTQIPLLRICAEAVVVVYATSFLVRNLGNHSFSSNHADLTAVIVFFVRGGYGEFVTLAFEFSPLYGFIACWLTVPVIGITVFYFVAICDW